MIEKCNQNLRQEVAARIIQKMRTENQVDLEPFAKDLKLQVEDLIILLLSKIPDIIIWKHFSVNQTWLAQKITEIISKAGMITYESIQKSMSGVSIGLFKLLILETKIPGYLTRDEQLFLTYAFIQKRLEDQIRIFTDISFEEIGKLFQVPVNYVEELLIEVIKTNIIAGKIDRAKKRLLPQKQEDPFGNKQQKLWFEKERRGSGTQEERLAETHKPRILNAIISLKEVYGEKIPLIKIQKEVDLLSIEETHDVLVHLLKTYQISGQLEWSGTPEDPSDDYLILKRTTFPCELCKKEIPLTNERWECPGCKRSICGDCFMASRETGMTKCPNCGEYELTIQKK